ncbi:MAG: DsrE family protein [Bacteroidota bacterium]
MIRSVRWLALLGCTFLFLTLPMRAQSQAQYPIVKGFGGIYEIPNSTQPDPDQPYRIVIDLKTPQRNKRQINRGLENVARTMNLHVLGGVRPENLEVVVAVHGGATQSVLIDEAYHAKNGVDNPNRALVKALHEAGATLYVCGQSLVGRGYEQSEIQPEVNIGLSMLTVVTTYMNEGYHLLVFD